MILLIVLWLVKTCTLCSGAPYPCKVSFLRHILEGASSKQNHLVVWNLWLHWALPEEQNKRKNIWQEQQCCLHVQFSDFFFFFFGGGTFFKNQFIWIAQQHTQLKLTMHGLTVRALFRNWNCTISQRHTSLLVALLLLLLLPLPTSPLTCGVLPESEESLSIVTAHKW